MTQHASFGQWIKQRRKALDLTQNELAEQIGCAAETIRKLEADARRPSKEIAERLADALIAEPDARQRLIQVARGRAPDTALPSPVAPARDAPRHNLPMPLTSFVGREREVTEVQAVLARTRLLTLTGVGGTGKTRLALEAATTMRDEYPGGVWLIELAPLTDQTLVPQTVAAVLGLREEPGRPLLATLTAALQNAPTLLLLDNCEHLLTACAQLIDTLLRTCSQLHIMATSRETLGILGETIYLVPPLAIPDAQRLPPLAEFVQIPSARLFMERTQVVQPQFVLKEQHVGCVAAICQRLDGLPLALELAAARVRALPVDEIAGRLDQRFRLLTDGNRTALPRHQTLHALIDWSYDLLTTDEQRLFRRLAVFAGGWSLEAAETVCAGDGLNADAILDLLTHLVDKSLVLVEPQATPVRYTMLETIRQYALERLTESGEAEIVQQRRAEYFLALAERAEPELSQRQQDVWLQRLTIEYPNIQNALDWFVSTRNFEAAARSVAALWQFWRGRGLFTEGLQWVEAILANEDQLSPSGLAATLNAAGQLVLFQNDFVQATLVLERYVALCRQLDDPIRLGFAIKDYGSALLGQGDTQQGIALLQDACTLFRTQNHGPGMADAYNFLGANLLFLGRIEHAKPLLEDALPLYQQQGNLLGIAAVSAYLAVVALRQADVQRAADLGKQCWELTLQLGLMWHIPDGLQLLGAIAARRGTFYQAACLMGAGDALLDLFPVNRSAVNPLQAELELTREQLGEAAFALDWAEGRAMTLEQAVAYALKGE